MGHECLAHLWKEYRMLENRPNFSKNLAAIEKNHRCKADVPTQRF